jgi:hypothetical protein
MEKMDRIEIERKLRELRVFPQFINWRGGIIPPTKVWYSVEDNRIHSDCGVTIPFDYDLKTQMYHCVFDISREIIDFYKTKGIYLEM